MRSATQHPGCSGIYVAQRYATRLFGANVCPWAYALGIDGLLTTIYCRDVRPVDVLQQPRSDRELLAFADGIRIMGQLNAERADRWTGGGRLLDYVLAPQPGALEAAYSYIATITL